MNYIFRPENWSKWSVLAIDKINKTIDSCSTQEHLNVAKVMVDNFIIITALEDNITEKDLEDVMKLFWLKLDLQNQLIFETNLKVLV
jgi:hypothetical protein